jgi:molybdate transport system substrate-binding protein
MTRLLIGALLAFCVGVSAQAAELIVYSATAMQAALSRIPAEYAAATGDQVRFVYGTAGFVQDHLAAAAAADVAIMPPSRQRDLAERGLVQGDTVKGLGETRLAVVVRRGAPHPRIVTEDEFRTALLAAPSLGTADPANGATTGIYLAKLFERMGLAAALTPKLHLYPNGLSVAAAAARGDVAFGIGQISEILPVQGAEAAGDLPETLQLHTVYAISLPVHPAHPGAARRLYDFLLLRAARGDFSRFGFEPVKP